jgi:hypothetical protein
MIELRRPTSSPWQHTRTTGRARGQRAMPRRWMVAVTTESDGPLVATRNDLPRWRRSPCGPQFPSASPDEILQVLRPRPLGACRCLGVLSDFLSARLLSHRAEYRWRRPCGSRLRRGRPAANQERHGNNLKRLSLGQDLPNMMPYRIGGRAFAR